jgi:hypothetical protein
LTACDQGAKQKLDLGVLFVVFNRPDTTARVLQRIKEVSPPRLYISADGPRPGRRGDLKNCRAVRKIVDAIDWPCDVQRLYRKENLGCGKAVSSAISWFFEHELEGLILEDDCLPEESFFYFCQELLAKYRHKKKIMHINGNTFHFQCRQAPGEQGAFSYRFTSFPQVWGWATWKRAWAEYDFQMVDWPAEKRRLAFLSRFPAPGNYFQKALHFDRVYEGKIDTWDYQWQYSVLKNNGVAIVPEVNLVSNIGYGDDSTHLKKFDGQRHNLPTRAIKFPLRHPDRICKNNPLDRHYARYMDMTFRPGSILKYLYRHIKPMRRKAA